MKRPQGRGRTKATAEPSSEPKTPTAATKSVTKRPAAAIGSTTKKTKKVDSVTSGTPNSYKVKWCADDAAGSHAAKFGSLHYHRAEKLAAEQGHDAAVGLEWGRESYKIATALWRLKKRE